MRHLVIIISDIFVTRIVIAVIIANITIITTMVNNVIILCRYIGLF